MKINYVEKKTNLFETDDGRFQMVKSQSQSGHKFTILDTQKNQKVGAPRSFTGAVGLTRHYLLQEKQAGGNPSTMPRSKIGDGVAPIKIVPGPRSVPSPTTKSNGPEKNSKNSQIVMAHLASIASTEGMFTTYKSTISNKTGLPGAQVDYWLNKFIAIGWVVELSPEKEGQPGSYGFDIKSDEVQNLIRNMPSRIVTKTTKSEPKLSSEDGPSSAGIMAGKAMIRLSELTEKVEAFMDEIRGEIATIKQELKEKEKPDTSGFESVLNYLEDSQIKVNEFIDKTFGVKIL